MPEPRVSSLEADLTAAHKTIEALVRRAEHDDRQHGADQFAVMKAMAALENTVAQRTRALRASEARYRALYDHSPDMILTVDSAGTIRAANQTSRRAFPAEELLGRPLATLFDAAIAPEIEALVSHPMAAELDLLLRDGRVMSVTAAQVPDLEDTVQVVLRDVTARRALETEVQHTRRLAAIGHLAAGVAHEINNPLAVIQLRLELLQQSPDRLPVEHLSQLKVVEEHVHRISRIVRNLQTFARPHSAERVELSVREVIESACEIAELWLRPLDVRLDVEPEDLQVLADKGRIEQVLTNLLVNAADAMERVGVLHIVARRSGEFASISVLDDGPGIPPQLLDKLFTPFVTGKSVTRGSGLGLAIAWGIVQEHGGTIRGDNRPAGGARFTFTLPLVEHPSQAVESRGRQDEVGASTLRLLVVEDERVLLETLVDFATEVGHTIVPTTTLADALRALDHETFDVVLTDIRLPDGNGLDLVDAIRAQHPDLGRRVVVMSGLFHEPTSDYRYLQKPFSRHDFLSLLAEIATDG